MDSLEQAIKLLETDKTTCVSIKNGEVYRSELKGIAPILSRLKEDELFFEGASAADKVIGKSAAMLLIKGKIKELYAGVISEHALKILKEHDIPVQYREKVPYIINRTGTGMCPMEESVLETEDTEEAYKILYQKIYS